MRVVWLGDVTPPLPADVGVATSGAASSSSLQPPPANTAGHLLFLTLST